MFNLPFFCFISITVKLIDRNLEISILYDNIELSTAWLCYILWTIDDCPVIPNHYSKPGRADNIGLLI